MGFSPRVCLAAVGTVRAVHGCTAETVFQFVESGEYLWVWDFSQGKGSIRNLKFWFDELAAVPDVRKLSLEEVIDCILPHRRAWFAPGEVCRRFSMDRKSLMRLRSELGLPVGNVSREPLAQFLRDRWIGAEKTAKKPPQASFARGASNPASATICRPKRQTGLKGLKEGHSGDFRGLVTKAENRRQAAFGHSPIHTH